MAGPEDKLEKSLTDRLRERMRAARPDPIITGDVDAPPVRTPGILDSPEVVDKIRAVTEPERAPQVAQPEPLVPQPEPPSGPSVQPGAGEPDASELQGTPRPEPTPPEDPDPERAARRARLAQIRHEGIGLQDTQLQLVATLLEKSGKEVTPENIQRRLENIHDKAKRGRLRSAWEYEIARIGAMVQYGHKFDSERDIRENYGKVAKEFEANLVADPTQIDGTPDHFVTIDHEGKLVDEVPVVEAKAEAIRDAFAGTLGGAAYAVNYTDDEMKKLKRASELSEDDLFGTGLAADHRRFGSPHRYDGPIKRKYLTVYTGQTSDGRTGYNAEKYREQFIKYHFDAIRRYEYKRPNRDLTTQERQEIMDRARNYAQKDVAQFLGRMMGGGQVVVNRDPSQTVENILAGEGFWWDPVIGPAFLGALELVNPDVAQWARDIRAPFVAMSKPVTSRAPYSSVSYGKEVQHFQKENFLHAFARTGLFTVLLSWAFDPDPDMKWNSRKHIEKVIGGYDYTQDAPVIGKALADRLGVSGMEVGPLPSEQILGVGGVIPLALLDPDLFGATITVGLGAAGKVAKVGKAWTVGTYMPKAARALDELAAGADVSVTRINELLGNYPEIRQLLEAKVLQSADSQLNLGSQGAVNLTKAQDTINVRAAAAEVRREKSAAKVGPAQDKAVEMRRAADEAQADAHRHLSEFYSEMSKSVGKAEAEMKADLEKQVGRYMDELGKAEAELGQTIVQSQKDLFQAELTFLLAQRAHERSRSIVQAVEALPPGVLPPKKGMQVEVGGKTFTYDSKVTVEGTHYARLLDPQGGKYVLQPLDQVKRITPWTKAEVLSKKKTYDRLQAEVAKLRDDVQELEALTPGLTPKGQKFLDRKRALLERKDKSLGEIGKILGETLKDGHLKAVLDGAQRAERGVAKAKTALDGARVRASRALRDKASKVEAKAADMGSFNADDFLSGRRAQMLAKMEKATDRAIAKEVRLLARAKKYKDAARKAAERMLEYKYPALPPTVVQERIVRQAARELANEIRGFVAVVKRTGNATPSADKVLTLEESVAIGLKEPTPGSVVLLRLEQKYGPRAKWGAAARHPLVEVMSVPGHKLDERSVRELFEVERNLYIEQAYRGEWVSARMEAAGRTFWDPRSDYWRKWNSPEHVLAAGYRMMTRFRQWFSPTYQYFGELSEPAEQAAKSSIGRYKMYTTESDALLRDGRTAADLVDYVTTNKEFMVRGTALVGNRGSLTLLKKFQKYVLGDPNPEENAALEALIRAALPSGEWGTKVPAPVREAALKYLREMQDKPDVSYYVLVDKIRKTTGRVQGKVDTDAKIMRHSIQAIIDGAAKYDMHYEFFRALGPLTPEHGRALNWLLSYNRTDAPTDIGRLADLDLEKGYEALNILGRSFGTSDIQQFITRHIEADKALRKWVVNNELGAAPQALVEHLTTLSRGYIKELEAYHGKKGEFNVLKEWLGWYMHLWRRTVVLGVFFPRFAHFSVTYFGDTSQIGMSRGVREAARHGVVSAPLYLDVLTIIPGVPSIGKRLHKSIAHHLIDPNIGAVLRGDKSVRIKVPEGELTGAEFLLEAKTAGVFEYLLSGELAEVTRRQLNSSMPEWMQKMKWSRRWTDVMEDLQGRVRLGVYMRDRARGLSKAQAEANLKEAMYDWHNALTPIEANYVSKLSGFYTFWRNALNQFGMALTEGVVKPPKDYWLRVATGRTKLGRARSQAMLAMGIPEFIWWDDPEEYLDSHEQVWDWAKRQAPWWLGVRPLLTNSPLSEEVQAWHRERGRDVNVATQVLPMLTALDSLEIFVLTHQVAATMLQRGMGYDDVLLSADTAEILSEALVDKLAPIFSSAVESAISYWRGDERFANYKGVPLRHGEVALMRLIPGMEDLMSSHPHGPVSRGTEEESGRYYMDAAMYNIVAEVFRSIPVIGTELPALAGNLSNPYQDNPLSKAYLMHVFRDFSGFGKTYVMNAERSHDRNVKRTAADLDELETIRKRQSLTQY